MKNRTITNTNALIRRRNSAMRKLANLGPMLRGSLCTARRGNHTAHQLTVSIKGKTHTVYVPIDMVKEVKTWINNHKRLQLLLKDISKLNMAIIHQHIPESRAESKVRRRRAQIQ